MTASCHFLHTSKGLLYPFEGRWYCLLLQAVFLLCLNKAVKNWRSDQGIKRNAMPTHPSRASRTGKTSVLSERKDAARQRAGDFISSPARMFLERRLLPMTHYIAVEEQLFRCV